MSFLNQKGIAQIALLLILLAGIAITVWGVQYGRTILNPRASEFDLNTTYCPDNLCYFDNNEEKWIHKHEGTWDNKQGTCKYAFDEKDDLDSCNEALNAVEQQRKDAGLEVAEDRRWCEPGDWKADYCAVCNSVGTGYTEPGVNWGDADQNPDQWCACAEKYSKRVPTPKEFTKENFPQCPNAKEEAMKVKEEGEELTCDDIKDPTGAGPAGITILGDTVNLSWHEAENAKAYAVRVIQTEGPDYDNNASFEENGTPNNCEEGQVDTDTYVCINGWKENSMTIKVQPASTYFWWVHSMDGESEDGNVCAASKGLGFKTAAE